MQPTSNRGGSMPEEPLSDRALRDAIPLRHSVRSYLDRPLDPAALQAVEAELLHANRAGGIRIELVRDEPRAFGGLASYGMFRGVRNYLLAFAPDDPSADERIGYWGERVVLTASAQGLDTCWAALTFSRRAGTARMTPQSGERLACAIALGQGKTHGKGHRVKPLERLCRLEGGSGMPSWFRRGMEAAQLAPTALNQQRFRFVLQADGRTVRAETASGPYTRIDLGIARLHFELGAGEENFLWG